MTNQNETSHAHETLLYKRLTTDGGTETLRETCACGATRTTTRTDKRVEWSPWQLAAGMVVAALTLGACATDDVTRPDVCHATWTNESCTSSVSTACPNELPADQLTLVGSDSIEWSIDGALVSDVAYVDTNGAAGAAGRARPGELPGPRAVGPDSHRRRLDRHGHMAAKPAAHGNGDTVESLAGADRPNWTGQFPFGPCWSRTI